jgi:hypothetical protein
MKECAELAMLTRKAWIVGMIIAVIAIGAVVAVLVMRSPGDADLSVAPASDRATAPLDQQTPTEPPEITWAGDVCAAVDNLRDVASAAALQSLGEIDPRGNLSDQATEQLTEVIAELQDPLAQLGSALGSVPMDYTEDPQRLLRAQQLTSRATEQVQEAIAAVSAIGQAETFVEQAIRAVTAIAAGQQVIDTGRDLLDALEQLDADGAFRDAFATAPQCTAL